MVTHLTTNPPVSCLNIAEQTGCVVLKILWSYVEGLRCSVVYVRMKWREVPHCVQGYQCDLDDAKEGYYLFNSG